MPSIFDSVHFHSRFLTLPSVFYEKVAPQPLLEPELVSFNPKAFDLIGFDETQLTSAEFLAWLTGSLTPRNTQPVAGIYSGHQFGQYNPQLGDGRALLIGEIEHNQQHYELQLKGSGLTPFSRMGDGRAVLRSSIREYLCQEAMAGLGIPTTRSLALATSRTPVRRETMETAATLIRMAETHIRFGHFEYFFYTKQKDHLRTLADFVIRYHFPELLETKDRYTAFFRSVVILTAELIAKWQAHGFCHGVMNTDNLSILGLTIDYGPFAFLDDFSLNHICNHSDHTGRYAFDQQINIGLWNLNALAHSLSDLVPEAALRESLQAYEPAFRAHYRSLMRQKLGLKASRHTDESLIGDLLLLLNEHRLDYTLFFRKLASTPQDQIPENLPQASFTPWFNRYWAERKKNPQETQTTTNMHQVNPKYILRNHLAQNAITQAKAGDFSGVNRLLTVLQAPFDEHPELDFLSTPPDAQEKQITLSCSS